MLPIAGGSFGNEGTISLHKQTNEISVVGSSKAKYSAEEVFQIKSEPLVKKEFHLTTFIATLVLLGGLLAGGLSQLAGPLGGTAGAIIGIVFAILWGRRKTLYHKTTVTFADGKNVIVEHATGEMRGYVQMAENARISTENS